jgi:hypothetical protein
MRRWALRLAFVLVFFPEPQARAENSFVLLGGLNLSSPRTAAAVGYTPYMGAVGGIGFNINILEQAFVELDFQYLMRRYWGTASIPTLMMPLLAKYESSWIMFGIGPYAAFPLGLTSDDNSETSLDHLQLTGTDFGIMLESGLKLKVTQRITAFGDVRISRAVSATYTSPSPAFYWTQVQASIGIQVRVGRNRR